jgi:signal transduction histidine kinase
MQPLTLILGALAGLCVGIGVVYLLLGLRRPEGDWLHLTFAFFSLAYAGANITSILEYKTDSLEAFLRLSDWTALFTGLALILLLWFVAIYTQVQPRIFLLTLTAVIGLVVLVAIFRTNSIHTDIFGIYLVTLPWGETITRLDASESIWEIIFFLSNITLVGYLIYACVRQYLSRKRREALVLGFGLLFLMFALIFDILYIDSGELNFVYLGDYGFIPLLIVMSLQLANNVVRTEARLAQYRRNLEALVEERTAELQQANLQLQEQIVERGRAEQTLRQRVEDLNLVNRVTQVLTKTPELKRSLQRVSEILSLHFGTRYAHIIVYTVEIERLMVLTGFDREDGIFEQTELDISLDAVPLTAQVLREGRSQVVSGLGSQPLETSVRTFVNERNLQSVLLVPLQVSAEVIGLLVLGNDEADREFTPGEVALAESIAGDIAVMIENARLQEQEMAAAASEERTRLARDLHDAVTQTIYSAALIVEVLPVVWERDAQAGQRNLAKLRQLVRGALGEMRTLLFELRPSALAAADLKTLLEHLGDALTGRTRIQFEKRFSCEADPPSEVKIALYRIAQEAFNNIAKHSQAARAEVELRSTPGQVILTIKDNGIGFDPATLTADKLGLRIMHERAKELGAKLHVRSQPGEGTQVNVEWSGYGQK